MYAVKSGAAGVGDAQISNKVRILKKKYVEIIFIR